MNAVRSARLTAAAIRGVGGLNAAIEELRRGSNHRLLVVAIVASAAMVAALDFWAPAELIGSILFTVPLVMCALQPSKRLLWGVATAAAILTIATGFWGPDSARASAS